MLKHIYYIEVIKMRIFNVDWSAFVGPRNARSCLCMAFVNRLQPNSVDNIMPQAIRP